MKNSDFPLKKYGINNLFQLENIKLRNIYDIPNCCGVYIFYVDKQVFYIGKSFAIKDRILTHLKTDRFIPFLEKIRRAKIFWFRIYTREVLLIERLLINHLRPLLNIQYNLNNLMEIKEATNGRVTERDFE
jgi:excinuclease UvrABC nuclease subunit